jgi:hypothetical protein
VGQQAVHGIPVDCLAGAPGLIRIRSVMHASWSRVPSACTHAAAMQHDRRAPARPHATGVLLPSSRRGRACFNSLPPPPERINTGSTVHAHAWCAEGHLCPGTCAQAIARHARTCRPREASSHTRHAARAPRDLAIRPRRCTRPWPGRPALPWPRARRAASPHWTSIKRRRHLILHLTQAN